MTATPKKQPSQVMFDRKRKKRKAKSIKSNSSTFPINGIKFRVEVVIKLIKLAKFIDQSFDFLLKLLLYGSRNLKRELTTLSACLYLSRNFAYFALHFSSRLHIAQKLIFCRAKNKNCLRDVKKRSKNCSDCFCLNASDAFD